MPDLASDDEPLRHYAAKIKALIQATNTLFGLRNFDTKGCRASIIRQFAARELATCSVACSAPRNLANYDTGGGQFRFFKLANVWRGFML